MSVQTNVRPGATLEPHTVIAHNFAEESANKIHSDEVAGQFGFRGGLVPGVALYAYMSVPVVAALGRDFLTRGRMYAKFIQPIYHGERATAHATILEMNPLRIELSLINAKGNICAVGEASLPESPETPLKPVIARSGVCDEAISSSNNIAPALDPAAYPRHAMPATKYPPTIDALPAGTLLGSIEWTHDGPGQTGEFKDVLEECRDPLPVYRDVDAPPHAALYGIKANRLLADNVDLGPWIHTASDIQFYAIPDRGEKIVMNGRIAEAYLRRGHDIVVLDLAVLGKNDRPLAHILHTAIVRPARSS